MPAVIRGSGGRAVVGYQTAATLGRWRREGETVAFDVDTLAPYWSERPITALEVPLGKHWYRWPVVAGTLAGRHVTIGTSERLGER